MKKQNLTKKLQKSVQSKPVLLGALGFSIILLLSLLQSQYGIFSSKPTPPPTPTFAPVPTTKAVYNSPTPNPDCASQTFTSLNLGISFNYAYPNCTQKFFPREIGNKVYLYNPNRGDEPFSGIDADFLRTILPNTNYFYVEVISKNPQDPVETAIQKLILQGYSQQDCQIILANQSIACLSKPGFQFRVISTPRSNNDTYQDVEAKAQRCPGEYTMSGINGINYFGMDTNHPNKLLFVKIGQSNISSGINGDTWDRTIKVLQ